MSGDAPPLDRLLELLRLEPLDRDLLLGDPGGGEGRLFGGLVAAQCVMAAGRTVREGFLHSLHAYFLRPGRHDVPIRFVVHEIRDGRTFTTRRVVAHQAGEAIFNLSASFTRPEEGISHQFTEMPEAPGPDDLPDWESERRRLFSHGWQVDHQGAVEARVCDRDEPEVAQEPRKRVWMRPAGPMPEDPLVHTAVLVYASDRMLISTAARAHAFSPGERMGASLDHAMWLHHPPRFDDWILYASESPVAHAARGLIHGAMFDRRGVQVASVVQEGLIRRRHLTGDQGGDRV